MMTNGSFYHMKIFTKLQSCNHIDYAVQSTINCVVYHSFISLHYCIVLFSNELKLLVINFHAITDAYKIIFRFTKMIL